MVHCIAVDIGGPKGDIGFGEEDMAQLTWNDVGLRTGPGARNVYCHQGCCEHLLVIKDVRRLHSSDPQYLAAYPVPLQKASHYPPILLPTTIIDDGLKSFKTQ